MAAWLAFIKSKLLLPEEEDAHLTSQIAENITLQIERLNSISGFLNTFLVSQCAIVATFFGFSSWAKKG